MRRYLSLAAAALITAAGAGFALAQSQFITPQGGGATAGLVVGGCLDAQNRAIPCDATTPRSVSGTVTAVQGGTWRRAANTGTPVASTTVTVGATSVQVFPAQTDRAWLLLQNQSADQRVWCNPAGAAAVAGPPSVLISAGTSWSPGGGSGYIPSAAVACIASAEGVALAAWRSP